MRDPVEIGYDQLVNILFKYMLHLTYKMIILR